MRKSVFYIFLLIIINWGCNSTEGKKYESQIITTHFPDGRIKAEVPFSNKKRHGVARSYYANGKLWQEVNYYNGYKHGIAKTYYKTGYLFQVSEYSEGRLNGIRKRYRRNGQLMAEIPYYQGNPAAGLKEYLLNKKEKNLYPAILVTPVRDEKGYTLEFNLTDRVRDVRFFFGSLDENGVIPSYAKEIPKNENGIAQVRFEGDEINEIFTVMASATTILGSPYITEQIHQVSIDE